MLEKLQTWVGIKSTLNPFKVCRANGLRAVAASGGTGCCHLPAQLLLEGYEHTDLGTGLEGSKWVITWLGKKKNGYMIQKIFALFK